MVNEEMPELYSIAYYGVPLLLRRQGPPASSTPAASTSWTPERYASIVAISLIVQALTTTITHATSKGTVVRVVQPYSIRCGIHRRTSGVERRVVNEK